MSDKNNIIIAIVAIVAIGFLVSESGQVSDLTGDASHKPSPTPTYTPPTCIDSDGGLNFLTPGTVTDKKTKSTFNDKCSGNDVVEWYCSGSYPRSQNFLCPYGCVTTNGIGHCAPDPRNST